MSALRTELPDGWQATAPGPGDVATLAELVAGFERGVAGAQATDRDEVEMAVAGPEAHLRRHLVVRDGEGRLRAWAQVHDRAAGRVLVSLTVDPHLAQDVADPLAATLLGWAQEQGTAVAADRGLGATQLDAGAFDADTRQQAWLERSGYERVRTWWQMVRPVSAEQGEPGAMPSPKPGVSVRAVVDDDTPEPSQADLRAVHDVLEESFADHFNYHEESFDEFLARQREDPGHAWDHWWIAEVTLDDGRVVPAGALVGQAMGGDGQATGSYVAYLGVLRAARGRGVARTLLHTVVADAACRGRTKVKLEVDATSPTGAQQLYTSLGFETTYATQSWHRDVPAPLPDPPRP